VSNITDPVSLRLPSDLHQRLQKAADQVGLPKHSLCQSAIRAAVVAIEEANGRLVLPIEFTVKNLPAPRIRKANMKVK